MSEPTPDETVAPESETIAAPASDGAATEPASTAPEPAPADTPAEAEPTPETEAPIQPSADGEPASPAVNPVESVSPVDVAMPVPPTHYTPSEQMLTRIDRDYLFHALNDDQQSRCHQLAVAAKALATLILELTPVTREQSLALTASEEALTWAKKAISRNE